MQFFKNIFIILKHIIINMNIFKLFFVHHIIIYEHRKSILHVFLPF